MDGSALWGRGGLGGEAERAAVLNSSLPLLLLCDTLTKKMLSFL